MNTALAEGNENMLTIDNLDNIFMELSKYVKEPTNIVVCGGASMVINYKSRMSTNDVDCLILNEKIKMIADSIASDFSLDCDWLNDNVCVTKSYSGKLLEHVTHYKTFGKLTVDCVSGLPLLCMKLVSWRELSNDYDDCKHLIDNMKSYITLQDVYTMLEELYGSSVISVDAEKFLKYEFGSSEFVLDEESIQSLVYGIKQGLQDIEDLPIEFREQVRSRL